ncbi:MULTISPECIES: tRNA lysidine(34) synthetase TilS [Clostridium]|uniref:tRNA(Ile)-lysidine synthase n=1 Tax=Clostridium cibarium TaxID=2762247 RepID=A0ABR8PS27_9CLOT|nr:tRNA lysidine(34) synthetase TilS [Clostridium sp. HBUAS56017]MBD7910976.1 tRNA lysidine(34) synthetase TilS [Clostridium cibarium]
MKERFVNYIEKNELIRKGDGIVVGLSGGPDSTCLLHLLCSIKDEMNLKIAAVHVNHMFRGDDADGDQRFSEEISKAFDVEFFYKKIDVSRYGRENGLSSETAGREIRYNYFNEIMNKLKFSKIATAHNANDQVETILMRIMRGTGLEGLGGIPVKRENRYIRPILFMKREEIEQYCKVHKLNPRIDETNLERLYSRNKVRLDMIPYMKENFNEDIIETINRMSLLLQEDNKFILEEVDSRYKESCFRENDKVVICKKAFEYNSSIIKRIIRKAIKEVNGDKYDVELKHIMEVVELSKLETGKKIDLPRGVSAENVYGDICIRLKKSTIGSDCDEIILNKNELHGREIIFRSYIFNFEVINNEKNISLDKNNEIKYFNYDSINGNIIIRQRKNGDKINPLGMKGSKKLKDIFIDMKIPKENRELIPIIQFDENIAWVFSIKISELYKVTEKTKKVLKISVRRKENKLC